MDAEKLETIYPRPNPYVGPRAFRTGEALYGRDREANELLDLLIAERIVLLYSPSGAGKSSLVQAALLPRLREESFFIHPIMRVNQNPPDEFVGLPKFNRYVYSVLLSLDSAHAPAQQRSAAELAETSMADYFKDHPSQAPEVSGEVLIFDQFEEILTANPADHDAKVEFFTQVGQMLRNRERWALFVMREDFIAGIEPFLRAIPSRLSNNFRLDLLRAEAALDSIRKPAQAAGVDFTEAAAQRLVNDLRRMQVQKPDGITVEEMGPYVEPVQLQVVCRRLWAKVNITTTAITEEDVDSIGDVDSALAAYYAERVGLAAKSLNTSEYFIRFWVNRYLITEQGIRGQVLMRPEASEGLDNRVIRLLQDAHLVRSEQRRGATWFELAHDRLLQPVRQNNNEWFNTNLSTLQRQANRWERESRPPHLLLQDEALTKAEQWAAENKAVLTQLDREYLTACQKAQRQRQEELQRAEERGKLENAQRLAQAEKLRAEEQADAAARYKQQVRAFQIAFAVTIVLAVVAVLAGAFAYMQEGRANTALGTSAAALETSTAALVTSEYNSNQALAAATDARANQLTAEANRIDAERNEKFAQQARQTAVIARVTAEAASTSAVQEGKIALSRQLASQATNIVRSDPDLALLLGIEAYRVADTEEAKRALAIALEVKLGRTTDPVTSPPTQLFLIYSLAFSPDGSLLAIGGSDGSMVWWNLTTKTVVKRFDTEHGAIHSLAFSPDGTQLASGGQGPDVFLWTVPGGVQKFRLQVVSGQGEVLSVAFSPDGTRLATTRSDNVIQIWDTTTYRRVFPPIADNEAHRDDIRAIAYSPDGKWFATGGADANVRVWDAATGRLVFAPPKTHTGLVRALAWSPDSKTLASGSRDRTILLWDVVNQQLIGTLNGHTREVMSLDYSRDGRVLASGSSDNSVILWDSFTREIIVQFSSPTEEPIRAVAFSPVENILASGGEDNTVLLQRVTVTDETDQSLPERACVVVGRNFKYDEWLEFFPGQPHRSTCAEWPLITPPPTATTTPN